MEKKELKGQDFLNYELDREINMMHIQTLKQNVDELINHHSQLHNALVTKNYEAGQLFIGRTNLSNTIRQINKQFEGNDELIKYLKSKYYFAKSEVYSLEVKNKLLIEQLESQKEAKVVPDIDFKAELRQAKEDAKVSRGKEALLQLQSANMDGTFEAPEKSIRQQIRELEDKSANLYKELSLKKKNIEVNRGNSEYLIRMNAEADIIEEAIESVQIALRSLRDNKN